MKNLTTFLLSCVFLLGTVACQNGAKTNHEAPISTQESPKVLTVEMVQNSQQDAQSRIRRNQLDSDIRAREQRNNLTGGGTNRDAADLESEVRSKLEANIPRGLLTIKATKDGTVTVLGTIPERQDIQKVEPLAMQIKGVKKVVNKVVYAPPKSE